MSAFRIVRRLRDLLDVNVTSPADGDVLSYDSGTGKWVNDAGGGGGGAPTDANYLVGTANAGLSAEIAVGTTPGGELGGTWASPTVDATHSGSSHASVQAAAEATAAAALASHEGDTTSVHGIADTSALLTTTAADAAYQPKDSDLTAIAALTTTSYGRAFLALADAAAARTATGSVIGTDVEAHDADLTTIAGLSPSNDDILQRKAGAWANRTIAQLATDLGLAASYQPLDSDLTAIAALTTTSFGRAFLALADAAAARTAIAAAPLAAKYIVQTADSELSAEQALGALGTGILKNTTTTGVLSIAAAGTDYQAADQDLTDIAALSPSNDDVIQRKSGAWTNRTIAQLKSDLGLSAPATGKVTSTAGNITTTSTSFADLTGMSITITTGANRVLLCFTGFGAVTGNANDQALDFTVDGTRQGGTFGLISAGGIAAAPMGDENFSMTYLTDALSAGSHTFKVQWRVTGGTGTMFASATAPITFGAVEIA